MSAISPRSRRPRRLLAAVEPLETRTLLAAQPTAVADAYTVAQGQTLAVSFARNYVVAHIAGSADPYTWTTADGPVTVYNVGTGDVSVSAGITGDPTTGWAVVMQTSSGLPLQPGTYVAAGGLDAQASLRWFRGGIHQQDGQFTVQHVEFDQGNYATRVDADFVVDGGDSGSVHYSASTRGVLDNDLGPAVGVTASLVTAPAHGSVSLNPDGTFVYTPARGFVGADSFTYAASDGTTTSAPATVTLSVQPLPTTQFTGAVMDVYDQANGSQTTPLVGRAVFDDADGNGQFDPGETTAVTGLDGRFAMTLPVGTHTIRLVPKAGWVTPDGRAAAAIISSTGGESATLYTTMANPVVIDVLAVYPAPVSVIDFSLPWYSAIRDAFTAANAIFANSDTNIRLNLVSVEPVKYTPANNLQLDLARLYTVGDGALDTVPKRRDALQADLTILFDAKGDGQRDGIAFVLNPARPDASRGYAVVVAKINAADGGAVLAHEIGHTIGADHDVANGPKNYVSYAHGYRYTGDDGVVYHDVMAYPPGTTLPFFSSPNLSYAGHALGMAGSADAARVVRENAYTVASYRGPVVLAPGSLAVSAATVTKATAKPGDAVSAKATVRNNAASKFSGKVAVAYYLSKDKTLDASDTLVKRTWVTAKNLPGKGTLASSAAFKVDAKLAAGTYYVLAVATPTGTAADERAAKAASAALKVAAPAKKTTTAKVSAARFQSARPIVEQAAVAERRTDDADDVITGLLLSPR